ncbi:MAG TPA: phosphoadenylyl-sulfate reductase [Bryobacterales bacterium]|nr:phosphoadenylyl-sulfate reductase [Bryobacterales bacterium]
MVGTKHWQEALAALESATAEEILAWGIETFRDRLAICTSFQAEGMVVVDMAARLDPRIRVFTLDTGRLPQQTYDLIAEVHRRYGIRVEVVVPDSREVEAMVSRHGPNLFYESVSRRMLCCEVRKVRPLDRKLGALDAWATGLRREQSETRAQVRNVEIDAAHGGIAKLNPLAGWSAEQVEAYTREHDVPHHALYAEGYASIGCAPCTRPALPGSADLRAGRWWWESDTRKECGIHFSPQGQVQRDDGRREVDVLLGEILHAV